MVTNLQIKFIKSLHLKKNRQESGQYICEGEKIVRELILQKPESIEAIYATESWISLESTKNLQVIDTSAKDMQRMSHHSTVPSVLALVNITKSSKIELAKQKYYLYLDQIADPGNLGTIIRTSDWYGHKQLFLSPNCVDVYNPKVIQSAMGSHFRVECIEIECEQLLKHHKFNSILSTTMKGNDLSSISNIENSLIVMGSESHGVTKKILELSTAKICIPSYGRAESLNVAVATGIILHHFTTNT